MVVFQRTLNSSSGKWDGLCFNHKVQTQKKSKSLIVATVMFIFPSQELILTLAFLEFPKRTEVGQLTVFICPKAFSTLRPHLFALPRVMKVVEALVLSMTLVFLSFTQTSTYMRPCQGFFFIFSNYACKALRNRIELIGADSFSTFSTRVQA